MHEPREAETHRLIGGDACLDFANTLNGHNRTPNHEYLHDWRDLLLWSRHAGILPASQFRMLLREAAAHPLTAARVYRSALELRELIFRIFTALAAGAEPALQELDGLNAHWQDGQQHAIVTRSPAGFALSWDDDPALESIPRSLCNSAVALLTSGKTSRIRMCGGEDCDWLFLDSSRNHLRNWCSMEECGNRAKMRRRQHRKELLRSM